MNRSTSLRMGAVSFLVLAWSWSASAQEAAPPPLETTPAPAPERPQAPPEQAPPEQAPPVDAAPVAPAAPDQPASEEPFDDSPPPAAPPTADLSDDPATASEETRDLSVPRVIDISKEKGVEEPPPLEPEIDPNTLPFTYHMRHVDMVVGFRVVGTPSDGLEPFLVDPVMVDAFTRIGAAFPLAERVSIAGSFEGSLSGADESARDIQTTLDIARITLGVEGRYHFHHRFYAYGRLAPGLELATVQLDVSSGDSVTLRDERDIAFHADGSAGLAMRFAGASDGTRRGVRFWGFIEGGYRLATKHGMNLSAEDGPARIRPPELASYSTSGGFVSSGLMLTF